jgi:demethylmenaquinone methyltransferase/2-methoxy-6-polyprenyl-1,4-benzoquinol methylase
LKPGGRLVVLEFDRPSFAPVRWFNSLYAGWIMPRTATLISNDKSGAYKYLPKSVETYLSRDALLEMMRSAGLGQARASSLSLGLCACYRAVRE